MKSFWSIAVLLLASVVPAWANPVCNAGVQQVALVGTSIQLDASGSSGSGALTYVWSAAAPTEPGAPDNHLLVNFSSTTAQKPTISGTFVFGPLNFHLVVTDMNGSTSCDVHDGAVKAGANGVVIETDPTINLLLGPQTVMNRSCDVSSCAGSSVTNPWSWPDQLQFGYAKQAFAIENMIPSPNAANVGFVKDWETAETGTCTFTNGSTTVSCSGTNLGASFGCTAPCSPSQYGFIIVWYCISGSVPTCFNSVDTSGRRYFGFTLVSNTSGTLSSGWPLATCTNCNFSKWISGNSDPTHPQSWFGGSTNNNYYDMAKLQYATYHRTGIEDFLQTARWFADAWWNNPYIDKFTYVNTSPRIQSMEGIVERMLDEESFGSSLKRTNLESWCDTRVNTIVSAASGLPVGTQSDLREESYDMWQLAMCAIFHSNATNRATYVTTGDASLKGRWATARQSDGSWSAPYCNQFCSTDGSLGTISATNGSNAITLSGATWSTGNFCNASTTAYIFMGTNIMSPTLTQFYAGLDTRGYIATRTGTTTATLDANYAGTTGSGKAFWMSCGGGTNDYTGPTTQPFFLGITSNMMRLWSYVLRNAASPDVTQANLMDNTWQPGIASWLGTTGYNSNIAGDGKVYGGPYYAVGGAPCGAPYGPAAAVNQCYGVADATQARGLSGEMANALATAYCLGPTSNLLTYINTFYGKMFAKFMTDTGYDGDNIAPDMELITGFHYPRYEYKWPPFYWGVGRTQSVPAALAGCTPSSGYSSIISSSSLVSSGTIH